MPPRRPQFSQRPNEKANEFTQFDFQKHKELLRDYLAQKIGSAASSQHFYISLDDLIATQPELVFCIQKDTNFYLKLAQEALAQNQNIPEQLERQIELSFLPLSTVQPIRFREVYDELGQLATINATITFASQILPECTVATYFCESCRNQFYVLVNEQNFTPPPRCPEPECKTAPVRLELQTILSKFADLRIYNVQEMAEEVPPGGVPREIRVLEREVAGYQCESLKPGERVQITGYSLPVLKEGDFFNLETIFILQNVQRISLSDELFKINLENKIEELKTLPSEKIYELLFRSFAPELFNIDNAKLACLCALVGGSAPTLRDIKIRPSINVLLVGDPGVAKSQLLKAAASTAERSCYVAGRGTSSAGLTAAAIRTSKNSPFVIEPGALILADTGIACLDEFDKLQEDDRAAIYEVLEQQTLSFSKAGVSASLQARTTVLAAANPKYSKWDGELSFKENLDLPEALISRFDIVFVMRDGVDQKVDYQLALHISRIHEGEAVTKKDMEDALPEALLRAYLEEVKALDARIQPELLQKYVEGYCQDRAEKPFTTPRALLATVRISQALAKLRGSSLVEEKDVDAARALMSAAEESAEQSARRGRPKRNANQIIKGLIAGGIAEQVLTKKALDKGLTEEEIRSVLDRFQALEIAALDNGVWRLQ